MTLGAVIQHGSVVLGKYRVESILGRGGMGIVVQARHLALDELVAIKMLREDVAVDDETRARFVREAQAAAKLRSEHVARIRDVGTFDDDKPYMVMEFLEGQDLGALIRESGKLHPSLAIDLVIQTCDALAEAHALGIVHRDIKPTNLFLTSHPDGSLLLKVLDFGISKATNGVDLSLTQTASMLGTPAYMSPEQMRSARRVDTRTDIWSLGSVLYEALEGHLPFQAESFSEMCVMVAVDPPAPMVAAPPALVAIVERCLAKHPDQRYQNVAEVARDLAVHAREPQAAQLLVDRMFRVLGRSRATPAPSPDLTPLPAPLPQPADDSATFVSPTTPTMMTAAGAQSLAASPPRRKRGVVVAVIAMLLAAAAAAALVLWPHDDATVDLPPMPDVSPHPVAAPPPPVPPAPAPATPPSVVEAPKPTPPAPAPAPPRPAHRPPHHTPTRVAPAHTPTEGTATVAPPTAGSAAAKPEPDKSPCSDPFSSRRGC